MQIIVDVETTGVSSLDVIVSVAILYDDTLQHTLVNEGKKIPPKASSIHNITNEMIINKPRFEQTKIYELLQRSSSKDTLIAHNVSFDLDMLNRSGVLWEGDVVDTMRVTKHLIPDLESYSLNFLRYEMRLYKKEKDVAKRFGIENILAHDAASDVIITHLLLEELLELTSFEEIKQLSKRPVLLQKFEFGKYAGRYIEEISMCDRGYLEWMLSAIEDLDEDMRYSLEYYL